LKDDSGLSYNNLVKLADKEMVQGSIYKIKADDKIQCKTCDEGKQSRNSFSTNPMYVVLYHLILGAKQDILFHSLTIILDILGCIF